MATIRVVEAGLLGLYGRNWLRAPGCAAGRARSCGETYSPKTRGSARRSFSRSAVFICGHRHLQSPAELLQKARAQHEWLKASANDSGTTPLSAPWTSIGPSAVDTSRFGLITGRVTSIAVDPSDSSGNTVYVGSTGGGVWKSTNAAGQAGLSIFAPLTDALPVSAAAAPRHLPRSVLEHSPFSPAAPASFSPALEIPTTRSTLITAQAFSAPPITAIRGVSIPNSMDGYYGSVRGFSFRGMGFAGFAWSSVNPQLVVAAVATSEEGNAVRATSDSSFAGLYYSSDAGQTWRLAAIEDGTAQIIQSAQTASTSDPGNFSDVESGTAALLCRSALSRLL